MNTVTETTNNTNTNTNSVEGLIALLESGGWAAEAAAVVQSGHRAQIELDRGMTRAQARVIRSIGLKRGQGILPCWIPSECAAIWAHSETVVDWQQVLPACYWERSSNGCYSYDSCTGNTEATVASDGVLRGKTRTTAARLSGDLTNGRYCGEKPPYLWDVLIDNLMEKYWDALAAFRALPDGYGCQEGKDLLASADKAIGEARIIATKAMANGADEWQELPADWLG